MDLVVYGDFNCPYSALASVRVDELVARGITAVRWRAVEHEPSIPAGGEPVEGELAADLEREVAEVRGLLRAGESLAMRVPLARSNTAHAVAAYAATDGDGAHELRRRLFGAVWQDGRNVSESGDVRSLGGSAQDQERAAEWREQWLGLEKRIVPMLVLPDGYVSRGLGALKRLADLAGSSSGPAA